MKFLKIATRDISSIFKDRLLRVSVVAIIIVPLLYSLLYLAAFWDPYSRLKDMPVAVVNLDSGAIKDGEKVNYGNDIIDKLKDNDKIGWRFVSQEEAEEGLNGSKYYAEFIIPEDFSKKVISAKDSKPEQPQILFSSNEKRNFLAAQINSKVQLELKDEISKTITKEYAEVVFDNLYDLKDGLNKAADGSGKLRDGLDAAKDGSKKLADGISQAKSAVDKAAVTMENNKEIMNLLKKDNISAVKSIMGQADALSNADTSMLKLLPKFATKESIDLAKKILIDYKAIDIEKQLNNPLIKTLPLIATPENLSNANKLIKDTELLSSIDVKKFDPVIGLLQNSEKISKLLGDANAISQVDTKSINNFINSQKSGAEQFINSTNILSTETNKNALIMAVNTNQNLSEEQKNQLIKVVDGYYNLTKETANNMASSAQAMAEVSGTIEKLAGVQQEFKENEKLIMGLQTFLNPENAKYMGDVFQQLVSMKQDLDANKQNLLAVKLLLANVNNPETKETLAKIAVLQKDIEKAKPLIVSINSNLTPEAISKLQDTPKLVEQLLSMQNTLKTNEQILKAAQSALNDGNIKLANDLINAIPTLSDGVNKLYEGSMKLNDGIVELADGSRELHEKLQDGADELNANLVNTSEEMGNFISEPVGMDVKPINPVKDYGTGFTPYFIPLSLWVGAIMMFFIITEKVDNDINASSASVVLGKFLSYSFIGVLQAVLASIVVLTLGLKPNNIVLYFVFNIFMSLVFIAIIQSLIFLLGQAGRLLSIVLLILQLTSCAGTFPLEVVPKFFKVLNPFMPFTYCVSALREIISGVNYSVLTKDITILALIMLVFLLISMLMKGHADKVQARIQERKQSIA